MLSSNLSSSRARSARLARCFTTAAWKFLSSSGISFFLMRARVFVVSRLVASSRQGCFRVALSLDLYRNSRVAKIIGVKINNVNTGAMLDRYFSQIMQVRSPALVTLQILRDAFA